MSPASEPPLDEIACKTQALALLSSKPAVGLVEELVVLRLARDKPSPLEKTLKDELNRTEGINKSLSLQRDELTQENLRLRAAIFDLQQNNSTPKKPAVQSTSSENGRIIRSEFDPKSMQNDRLVQIPYEILQTVFRFIGPPFKFIHSSYSSGPDTIWCTWLRTMKSVVLVSKSWCYAGLEILYEHVVIRQVGQASALAYTLETTQKDIHCLIRGITVECLAPIGYETVLSFDTRRILDHCPRVVDVIFNPIYEAKFNNACLCEEYVYPTLHNLSQHLTHLEIACSPYSTSCLQALASISSSLQSLVIQDNRTSYGVRANCKIHLPRLQSLHVHPLGLLPYLAENWTMPCLTQFSSASSMQYIPSNFWKLHGNRLTFLSTYVTASQPLKILSELCPFLEHLVLNKLDVPLAHPNLKWIDVWTDPWYIHDAEQYRDIKRKLDMKNLPALRGVRLLDHYLQYVPDLPLLLPPDQTPDYDGLDHTIRMAGIVRGTNYIEQKYADSFKLYGDNIDIFYDSDASNDTYDEDGSQVSSSDDDYSDFDDSDDPNDKQTKEDVAQVDHATALSIFWGQQR